MYKTPTTTKIIAATPNFISVQIVDRSDFNSGTPLINEDKLHKNSTEISSDQVGIVTHKRTIDDVADTLIPEHKSQVMKTVIVYPNKETETLKQRNAGALLNLTEQKCLGYASIRHRMLANNQECRSQETVSIITREKIFLDRLRHRTSLTGTTTYQYPVVAYIIPHINLLSDNIQKLFQDPMANGPCRINQCLHAANQYNVKYAGSKTESQVQLGIQFTIELANQGANPEKYGERIKQEHTNLLQILKPETTSIETFRHTSGCLLLALLLYSGCIASEDEYLHTLSLFEQANQCDVISLHMFKYMSTTIFKHNREVASSVIPRLHDITVAINRMIAAKTIELEVIHISRLEFDLKCFVNPPISTMILEIVRKKPIWSKSTSYIGAMNEYSKYIIKLCTISSVKLGQVGLDYIPSLKIIKSIQ